MPHEPTDTDPQSWHRYFAVECNNRAWELSIARRSPVEGLEMLDAAHAAALHWAAALAAIADDVDREIVARTFNQVPEPLPTRT